MKFVDKLELIERLASLIDRKATGTPQELAKRLKISKRHVHNIIQQMRDLGGPIDYCPKRRTYYFTRCVFFQSGFVSGEDEITPGETGSHGALIYQQVDRPATLTFE